MKIATYNMNGINERLAVLLRLLKETFPEVVRLQELKAPDAGKSIFGRCMILRPVWEKGAIKVNLECFNGK